jgi:hypothetical protein
MHARYAEALVELGTPLRLPRSDGWILKRAVPGLPDYDARGCYPLFACPDWSRLQGDLEDLGPELVSLALVTDPFGDYDPSSLCRCFPDVVSPYKEHYVVDLERPMRSFVSPHHVRNIKTALRHVDVECCDEPAEFADDWVGLYSNLVRRHAITGIAAFSRLSLMRQLQVPGIDMFRAVRGTTTVGMTLWYTQRDVSYYHLGAYNDAGYASRASFALFAFAIEYFAGRRRWLSLGAGAGARSAGADGLTRFKSGWATGTRTAYLCGRIFDRARYAEIADAKRRSGGAYFPVYRTGEQR